MAELWAGVFGICGVLLGVIVNEVFRRQRRIEAYTARLFDRRLNAYEGLMKHLYSASRVAADVMENPKYTAEERLDLISSAIHEIAAFTDRNELYLDRDLASHCVATFMGAEDIQGLSSGKERTDMKRDIWEQYGQARQMIREDSGIAKIERHFRTVAKPVLTSPVIDRIRYLREHPKEAERSLEAEMRASTDKD